MREDASAPSPLRFSRSLRVAARRRLQFAFQRRICCGLVGKLRVLGIRRLVAQSVPACTIYQTFRLGTSTHVPRGLFMRGSSCLRLQIYAAWSTRLALWARWRPPHEQPRGQSFSTTGIAPGSTHLPRLRNLYLERKSERKCVSTLYTSFP